MVSRSRWGMVNVPNYESFSSAFPDLNAISNSESLMIRQMLSPSKSLFATFGFLQRPLFGINARGKPNEVGILTPLVPYVSSLLFKTSRTRKYLCKRV